MLFHQVYYLIVYLIIEILENLVYHIWLPPLLNLTNYRSFVKNIFLTLVLNYILVFMFLLRYHISLILFLEIFHMELLYPFVLKILWLLFVS